MNKRSTLCRPIEEAEFKAAVGAPLPVAAALGGDVQRGGGHGLSNRHGRGRRRWRGVARTGAAAASGSGNTISCAGRLPAQADRITNTSSGRREPRRRDQAINRSSVGPTSGRIKIDASMAWLAGTRTRPRRHRTGCRFYPRGHSCQSSRATTRTGSHNLQNHPAGTACRSCLSNPDSLKRLPGLARPRSAAIRTDHVRPPQP